MNLQMLWKFYSAKTAGMQANFTGLKRNLYPYYFLDCFHIQCPSAPMSIYISVVFTGEISKYPSTFET